MVNQVLTTNQVMTTTEVLITTLPDPQNVQPATGHRRVEDGLTPDRHLDITADGCPMTFVRTRLALDRMSPGQTLLVLLRGDEPRARVPATAAQLGHAVVHVDERSDGTTRVLIRRA